MRLDQALKTSLDELRMQMLGVQVLFGFQFQGLFQDGFEDLSALARSVYAAGLALLLLALVCWLRHRLSTGSWKRRGE